MMYEVQPGACNQSYGIHVAKMADFPNSVLVEAKRKADQLEKIGPEYNGNLSIGIHLHFHI